ncbi:MAG: biopolymer transporter ExbD [Candidatus Marinimicrobia bacterium]|nr:biopolymer transporter ExbD [Candidatus Neomarinimicrobiota bacterium]MCF7840116.1 biopolymer transporter ExbD [Candidatus Neomarinimicrobiota bacterium]MCF7902650.1 biopolymer transporter ExbD [Candidatus Neomarinimicrobiota bacterium]
MKLKQKTKVAAGIPTASLPDIIFMLLIFFMVVTVLRQYQGLKLILPEAKKISKLEGKRHVTNIWITKEGIISIDDRIMEMSQVRTIMYDKRVNDPQLTTSLKADRQAEMKLITGIHQELREADALKINYSAKTKN